MGSHHRSLDPETTERLVAGGLGPDDAPPGFRRTAELLTAARAIPPAAAAGSSSESALVSAMATAIGNAADAGASLSPARRSRMKKLLLSKVVLATGALTLSASAAGAATGTLPDVVQDKVANVASHVGLNLPTSKGVERDWSDDCAKADEQAGTYAKNRGQYLKQERAKGAEALAAAKASRCGMPITADDEGEDEAPETGEEAPATEPGKSGDEHGKPENPGQNGQDKAAEAKDKAKPGDEQGEDEGTDDAGEAGQGQNQGSDNSEAGADNGQAGEDNSQAGKEKAEAGEDNSQAEQGQESGQAGENGGRS